MEASLRPSLLRAARKARMSRAPSFESATGPGSVPVWARVKPKNPARSEL